MKKIVFLFACLFIIFEVKAEINIGNSIEWLCADAGLIATGKMKSYSKATSGNNLWICTFETQEIFKGTTVSPVSFTLNNINEDSLKKYVSEQTLLLVFLKENEKPYKKMKTETLWYAMETCNSVPAMINLFSPQQLLISAYSYSVLQTLEMIVSVCRMNLKKVAEYEVQGHTVFMNYLLIPYQTPAYSILYSGSSCYLAVPDFMFPDSKEKLY